MSFKDKLCLHEQLMVNSITPRGVMRLHCCLEFASRMSLHCFFCLRGFMSELLIRP